MAPGKLGRPLGAIVAVVAVLNTLSALSMPVREQEPGLLLILTWLALLSLHAAAYGFGGWMRERFNLHTYTLAQGTLIFAIAVSGAAAPLVLGLFVACTAELVVLAGRQWGTVRITIGAIALFVLAALITSDLYRATTAGLLLSLTGLIAHALGGLGGLVSRPAQGSNRGAGAPDTHPLSLSSREHEVLRELVGGARNSDIARTLGISERTVKSHLGSIYQKLGVETRAGAVATAIQRKLV